MEANENRPQEDVPVFAIAYDPTIVTQEVVAELTQAIEALVKACGGEGLKFLGTKTVYLKSEDLDR